MPNLMWHSDNMISNVNCDNQKLICDEFSLRAFPNLTKIKNDNKNNSLEYVALSVWF